MLGCSIGVEVYSILWILRRDRPDLKIVVEAVDVSPEVLEVARQGVYGPGTFDMVDSEVFEQLSESELQDMFDWDGQQARVKPWLQEGITWEVGRRRAIRRPSAIWESTTSWSRATSSVTWTTRARTMHAQSRAAHRVPADTSSSRVWIWTFERRWRVSSAGSRWRS